MSLRTKLLAAILGLNGAILLLALSLLVRSESAAAAPPSRQFVLDLVRLGSALAPCADPREGLRVQERLSALESSGVVKDFVVVQEERDPAHDQRVRMRAWLADDFLIAKEKASELPPDDPRRAMAIDAFTSARQHRNLWSGNDAIAIVLESKVVEREDAARGLVARYVAPPPRRSGVRLVYLVMVAGGILLIAVSFALISRLVMRPLGRISEAADRIARGDYRIQVEQSGTNDEFDRTIAAVNRMAHEIGEYQGHLEDRVLSALNRMRKAEQHLAIAQRLAATGKLAAGVAHEINNPLGGIKNAVRALSRGDLSEEKTREYLDLIAEGLGRVEETVKKFLSFTPRRVEPRPTDLSDVAQKAIGLAMHRVKKSGATLEEMLAEPGTVQVFGDPHELQQVALNLLLNAADAVAGVPDARIRVRVARRRDEGLLEVGDNGVGLSPGDHDRCFDLFFTTKEVGEGSGLGLAVAHTIVTNHGGRIELESSPDEGATFRVLLPAEDPGGDGTEAPPPAS